MCESWTRSWENLTIWWSFMKLSAQHNEFKIHPVSIDPIGTVTAKKIYEFLCNFTLLLVQSWRRQWAYLECRRALWVWRTLEDSGGLWRTLEDSGGLWRTLEDSAGLWRTLEDSGGLWRTLEDSGGSWSTLKYLGALSTFEHYSVAFLRTLEHSAALWNTLKHFGALWSKYSDPYAPHALHRFFASSP